jgi:hypothetical protein
MASSALLGDGSRESSQRHRSGGSRATATTSDRHAARLTIQDMGDLIAE